MEGHGHPERLVTPDDGERPAGEVSSPGCTPRDRCEPFRVDVERRRLLASRRLRLSDPLRRSVHPTGRVDGGAAGDGVEGRSRGHSPCVGSASVAVDEGRCS